MKKFWFLQRGDTPHWVGDGFPVRSMFNYNEHATQFTPFLLMDYGGPVEFEPTQHRRGVGEHPHRGFETVTIVYAGEVEHRDSAGGGGTIGPGDVQWMTAGSGLVHEEKHSRNFAKSGGRFEMVQLWVNLPRVSKMVPPRYQGILSDQIPSIALENGAGTLRLIAGEYSGQKGPALTYSPVSLWDLRLNSGKAVKLQVPAGHTAALFVLDGEVKLTSGESVSSAEIVMFDRENADIEFEVVKDSKVLFLGGEPILEPVIGYGPFVMNERKEILQAMQDYENGLMGKMKVT